MSDLNTRTINVDYLSRVEGEGAYHVKVENERVVESRLKIFEPPRFFEGFLVDRSFREAPDITARICGICPAAYQMSAVHAMEKICDYKPAPIIHELRRLLYCGEWIESHALHTFMLHAPDFLGYPDAITMAKDHKEWVQKALQLKKAGNDIVRILGGREIHPINVKVGGFYRYPHPGEFKQLRADLDKAMEIAYDATLWMAGLDYPEFDFDYEYVSLRHPSEYPMNEGRLVSNKGMDMEVSDYESHFEEQHQPYSTTLHTILDGKRVFLTGPLARYNLNFHLLTSEARKLSKTAKLSQSCHNPFKSLLVRMVETFYACQEAIRLIDAYLYTKTLNDEVLPKAGIANWITEAPRGILYHRYEIDDEGLIKNARIVAPTSHNQKIMEDDLRRLVSENLDLDHEALTHRCEQSIRNYDPCISCSTHFLKLKIDRS